MGVYQPTKKHKTHRQSDTLGNIYQAITIFGTGRVLFLDKVPEKILAYFRNETFLYVTRGSGFMINKPRVISDKLRGRDGKLDEKLKLQSGMRHVLHKSTHSVALHSAD